MAISLSESYSAMSELEESFTTLTGSDFIWSASLKTNLYMSLFSGFVIPYYSSLPAAGISINFMALPCFRHFVACLSPRRSGSYPRLCHVGIFGQFGTDRKNLNTSFSLSVSFHQYPKLKLHSHSPKHTQYSHCR